MTGVISRVLQHKLLFIETAASWLRVTKIEGKVNPVEIPQLQCRGSHGGHSQIRWVLELA